jgi:hypothetical protein
MTRRNRVFRTTTAIHDFLEVKRNFKHVEPYILAKQGQNEGSLPKGLELQGFYCRPKRFHLAGWSHLVIWPACFGAAFLA